MRKIACLAAVAALAAASGIARAAPSDTRCTPVVRDAWVRMTPTMPMGAAYFVVENPCRASATLVGAASPDFRDVSVHESRIEGGMSRMRPLPRVVLAPGARVVFAPGGRHVMLMAPTHATGAGVRLELRLDDGRVLTVDAPVRRAAP